MADYAPNYTGRYRVRYSTMGQQHVMTLRFGRAALSTILTTEVTALLEALQPVRVADWTILGAEVAAFDSDLFFPAANVPTADPGDLPVPALAFSPVFISFQGRTTGGSRASLYVYGVGLDPLSAEATTQDYRVLANEAVWCANAVAVLNGSSQMTGIDGNVVRWKPYVNVGVNSYYQRKKRG